MDMIENYFNLPKEIRNFIDEYNTIINYFNEAIYFCQSPRGFDRYSIVAKNTDLWIESRIKYFPELSKFRSYVRKKLKDLDIDLWTDDRYKESNHYSLEGTIMHDQLLKAIEELSK